MIRFFDTLSGKLKDFDLPPASEVKMYTCGPTVYDYAHIGNFRTFVFEDLLRRFLEYKGYKVKHVMNVTDVDDKTIAGASREGKSLGEFTKAYTEAFLEDLKTLNILMPNHPKELPRATCEIPAMIELIQKLIEKDAAYVRDGSVYYRVASFPGYGNLSKKDLKRNIKGARVDLDEYDKEEGSDFALWKKAKENEPSWDSPWGKGRPGWHVECSAMSMKYLGETFDIHAGGEDLIFPHHENEIAQSEAATGKPFVRYWLHAKHLLVNGEKMSKSKGNYYTLRDLLAKGYDPMAIRYALLSVHYRQQLNFTLDGLQEVKEIIDKLDNCYFQSLSLLLLNEAPPNIDDKAEASGCAHLDDWLPAQIVKMADGLSQDLNVATSFSFLQEAVKEINIRRFNIGERHLRAVCDFFQNVDELFGLDISFERSIPNEIVEKLRLIKTYREKNDYVHAGPLRDELATNGWAVKDGRPGESSTVKKKRRAWDQ